MLRNGVTTLTQQLAQLPHLEAIRLDAQLREFVIAWRKHTAPPIHH
jgi:hypothetical protein